MAAAAHEVQRPAPLVSDSTKRILYASLSVAQLVQAVRCRMSKESLKSAVYAGSGLASLVYVCFRENVTLRGYANRCVVGGLSGACSLGASKVAEQASYIVQFGCKFVSGVLKSGLSVCGNYIVGENELEYLEAVKEILRRGGREALMASLVTVLKDTQLANQVIRRLCPSEVNRIQ